MFELKYFFRKFNWIKILNSPFNRPQMSFYYGEIKMGTPYFLPRRSVKSEKKGYFKFVDRKFGFDFVGLGWKTKWDDIRHEWNPLVSFVIFNRQFCIFFGNGDKKGGLQNDCYWEAWLYYHYRTDKNKTKVERLKQVFEQYSCTWGNKEKGYHDYFPNILKEKYHKYIPKK